MVIYGGRVILEICQYITMMDRDHHLHSGLKLDLWDRQVLKVLLVHRVLKDIKDIKVLVGQLVLKVIRVRLEL